MFAELVDIEPDQSQSGVSAVWLVQLESVEWPGAGTLQHNNNTQGHQQQLLFWENFNKLITWIWT